MGVAHITCQGDITVADNFGLVVAIGMADELDLDWIVSLDAVGVDVVLTVGFLILPGMDASWIQPAKNT